MGGGKVKGQFRPVGTLVVRERMGKALAVQSGRALPMGRCASPPSVYLNTFMTSQIGKYLMGKISTTSDFHDKFVCQIKVNLALY